MTNLIIADDHTVFREGLASFFKDEDEISVIAEVGNGEEVLAMLPQLDVQIVLMDISMPKMDGIEASQMIKTKFPGVKIIMLTMHETQNYIRKLLDIGVDGYCSSSNCLTGSYSDVCIKKTVFLPFLRSPESFD